MSNEDVHDLFEKLAGEGLQVVSVGLGRGVYIVSVQDQESADRCPFTFRGTQITTRITGGPGRTALGIKE